MSPEMQFYAAIVLVTIAVVYVAYQFWRSAATPEEGEAGCGTSRVGAQDRLRRLLGHGLAGAAEGDGLSVWHSTTSTGAGIVDHTSAPKCTCVT